MTTRFQRGVAHALIACSASFGVMQQAGATLITADEVARAQAAATAAPRSAADAREHLRSTLARADVAQALAERGVSIEQAKARVAALTDDEAVHVAQQIDDAPAGAGDVLGVIVFIFVLLLVTDILGLTKVFPFTRSVR
jgi:hypothetical protein